MSNQNSRKRRFSDINTQIEEIIYAEPKNKKRKICTTEPTTTSLMRRQDVTIASPKSTNISVTDETVKSNSNTRKTGLVYI